MLRPAERRCGFDLQLLTLAVAIANGVGPLIGLRKDVEHGRLWDVTDEGELYSRLTTLDYDSFDEYRYLVKYQFAQQLMKGQLSDENI